MAKELYTIGYAGFPERSSFTDTLQKHGVEILIDVRSSPYSTYFSAYNRENLQKVLAKLGIHYRNFAKQFGARQENRSFFRDGILDFELFSQSAQFLQGVYAVEKSKATIAFMCAEKNPADCHRTILVAKAFHEKGYSISHITPEGILSQPDIEAKLLDEYFPDRKQNSLFDERQMSEKDYIKEAYRKQNEKTGYRIGDITKETQQNGGAAHN